MSGIRSFYRGTLSLMALAVLLSDGCTLPHADPRPQPQYQAIINPAQYCPGDTVTASYDIAGSQPCFSHSGFNCADVTPNVDVTSSPEQFPAGRLTGFIGSREFMPTAATYTVTFAPTLSPAVYPIDNRMGGSPLISRATPPVSLAGARIEGTITRALTHGGMCVGSTPAYAPAALPSAPEVSERLRIQQICNTSDVPIIVMLSSSSGPGFTGMLTPDQCTAPGAGADARSVQVNTLGVDPSAMCSATSGSTPPRSLRTRVTLACG